MSYGLIRPPILEKPDSFSFMSWFQRVFDYAQSQTGFATVTSAYTVEADVWLVRVDATAGAVTVTLPAASSVPGRQIYLKKIDASANAAILAGAGTDLIDGSATRSTTTQYGLIAVFSNGNGWDRIEA